MPATYNDWKPTYGWIVTKSTDPTIKLKDPVWFAGTGAGDPASTLTIATTKIWPKLWHDSTKDQVTFGSYTIERNIAVTPKEITCNWLPGPDEKSGGSWTAEEGSGSTTVVPNLLKWLLLVLLAWLLWQKWPKKKAGLKR